LLAVATQAEESDWVVSSSAGFPCHPIDLIPVHTVAARLPTGQPDDPAFADFELAKFMSVSFDGKDKVLLPNRAIRHAEINVMRHCQFLPTLN